MTGQGGARAPLAKPAGEVVTVQAMDMQSFLAFVVDAIWATKNKKTRSDVIKVVTEAAGRFLVGAKIGPEELHTFMRLETIGGEGPVEGERKRPVEGERKSTDRSEHIEEGDMDGVEEENNMAPADLGRVLLGSGRGRGGGLG